MGAFLSASDTVAACLEGIDEILRLFSLGGVQLLDHFRVFMSDNQSGLHSAVKRRYNLIAMSCYWHIGDAWNRKVTKYQSTYDDEQLIEIEDCLRLGKKSICESGEFFHSFID